MYTYWSYNRTSDQSRFLSLCHRKKLCNNIPPYFVSFHLTQFLDDNKTWQCESSQRLFMVESPSDSPCALRFAPGTFHFQLVAHNKIDKYLFFLYPFRCFCINFSASIIMLPSAQWSRFFMYFSLRKFFALFPLSFHIRFFYFSTFSLLSHTVRAIFCFFFSFSTGVDFFYQFSGRL